MGGGRPGGKGGGAYLTEEEKANRPKVTWSLIKRIGSYLKPYWKQISLVLITLLLESAFSLRPAILTGRIIDEGLIGQNWVTLVHLIIQALLVILLANIISIIENYLSTWIAQHISYDMRNGLYRHMQSLSHRFYTKSRQGELITRMTSDIDGVQRVIATTYTSILSNVIILVIALTAMFSMNAILTAAALLIIPLFILPTKRVGRKRWNLTRKSQEFNDRINGILNETLSVSGQMLVKLFTNEQREYGKYEEANSEIIKLNIKEGMTGRWFRMGMSSFAAVGPILIYLVGGMLMMKYNQDLSVGDITIMVALLTRMYQPINALLNIQVEVIRSMALFTRIFEYMDIPVEIQNKPNSLIPEEISGSIIFENVSFHYDDDKPILKNLNISVRQGQSLAIVGASGAGKSTFIQLLPRLYDAVEGRILLDGHDIKDIDLTFLRKSVGMVTQESYLFNGTVRENLLYARENATDDELREACRLANLDEFIESLPLKYDTIVGNRGIKLSGGEKQRLSLARIILKNPCILILDEATSSLDSISESLIQEAIEPLLKGRTSIIIAHRLSTIMAADEIMVMNDGQIAERGTHRELLQRKGLYSLLYETQFRQALDDHEENFISSLN